MPRLPKEKRDRIVLVGGATAILLALVWFFLITAQQRSLASARQKVAEIDKKISDAERLLKQADLIQAELETARQQLEGIEANMAPVDKFTWINLTLSRFRLPYHVEIAEFGQPTEGEVEMLPKFPYKAATCTIRGTGFYHALGKFFADFENTFPYIHLQNLELDPSPSTSAEDAEKLTFKVDIVALVKPTTNR